MRYYTYIHATPDGDIFYVGKGTGRRVYSMGDRTVHWKSIVEKNDGVLMKIVARFETESEAFEHEKLLIDLYKNKGCELVNLTEGGSGPLGYVQSEECRMRKKELLSGYVHKKITCPKCGKTGGETSMKRWHFDKCSGNKRFKARAAIDGVRVFLGNYSTKPEALRVEQTYIMNIMDGR